MNLKGKQFMDTFIGIPLVYLHIGLAWILGRLLRRDHTLQQEPEEIVILKLLGFGSVIMASDYLYSLKQQYPKSRFSIVCSSGIQEGIQSLGLFDKLYVVEDLSFWKTVSSSLSIIFHLQRRRTWILDLEVYSKLTSIFSIWTLAENRFGFYFSQVSFRYNLNTHNIFFNPTIQVEENYKRMVEALGVVEFQPFYIPGYEKKSNSRQLDCIALNNTCSELAQERKLTTEQMNQICTYILQHTTYKIALLGAPSDYESIQKLVEEYQEDGKERLINTAGKYRFEEYYQFLYRQCKLMITIDSAPLHIANKLNIPNLSIWGPTGPGTRIDLKTNHEYIYLHKPCSPCTHVTDKLPCGGNNICIKDIPMESLFLKIQAMLDNDH